MTRLPCLSTLTASASHEGSQGLRFHFHPTSTMSADPYLTPISITVTTEEAILAVQALEDLLPQVSANDRSGVLAVYHALHRAVYPTLEPAEPQNWEHYPYAPESFSW